MQKFIRIGKRLVKWSFIVAVSLVILLIILLESFDRYLSTEKGIRWMFSEVPASQVDIQYTASGIRYLSIGDSDKPALLMVHGAPGSVLDWLNFASHARIYERYRLLLADRPGYGGTRMRQPMPSIIDNARLMQEVIQSEPDSSVLVMGHSYGAPIALAMGALDSLKINRIIASSGQYDPGNEVIFNVSYLIEYPVFKYLIPYMFWVANEEKMAHPEACREALPYYPKVKPWVHLLHGNADGLVMYENSVFVEQFLQCEHQLITLEGFGHFLPGVAVDFLVDFALDANTPPPVKTLEE